MQWSVLDLKQIKDEIKMAKVMKAEAREKYGLNLFVKLQKQINSIVVNQTKT